MHLPNKNNLKGIAYGGLGFLFFSIADSFIKNFSSIYGGAYTGFITLCFSMIFIIILFKPLGGKSPKNLITSPKLKWMLLRGLAGTVNFFCFITAIQYIDLTTAYTLTFTSAFWVILISFILNRHSVTWQRLLTTTIGFIGVLIVLRPDNGEISWPALLILCSAICSALSFSLSRKIGEKEPYAHVLFYIEFISFILIGLYCLIDGQWIMPQLDHLFLLFLSTCFYLLAMIFVHRAFSIAETTAVSPTHYSQIIWGTLIGYFIFHETPDTYTIIGSIIIVACGLHLIYREYRTHHPRDDKTIKKEEG